jgi:transcriptional regulator with XRE-family HTH domain
LSLRGDASRGNVTRKNLSPTNAVRLLIAFDMAERLGMNEATYTKYERGETKITIDFVQKVAEELKIDPIKLLLTNPGSSIESGNNSPNAIISLNANNCQTSSEEQTKLITRLVENVIAMNKKVMQLLEQRR